MRIALVSREVSPFFGAGIGTYAAAAARAWAAEGHEVHVISEAHDGFPGRGPSELGGARCHSVSPELTPEFEDHPFPFMRHAMGVYRLLLKLHAAAPFDYIEVPDYWAEGYFAIRAKRTLGHFQDAVLAARLHTPTRECRALNDEAWLDEEIATLESCEDSAVREADVVLSPSRSLLDLLSHRLHLSQPRFVVPYPFEMPKQSQAAAPTTRPTVFYYGRMERRKGVHLLIQAAQRLLERGVNADFRLIGGDTKSGPSGDSVRGQLARMIDAKWKDRIQLQGPVPRHELTPLIRSVAAGGGVCCFPSLWENYPNTCLEAMSLGCPVVGSDAGGMAEMIEDGISGVLFRSGDLASLTESLARVLGDSHLRASMSHTGPGRIASICEPAAVVAQLVAAIRSVGPGRGPIQVSPGFSPTVSIIVPFYNLSRYLPETLASVRAQTFKDLEVIVVDDGSTEPEAEPLMRRVAAGELGPARVIRQDNRGLSAARNTGIAAARGKWVLPLDADDLLEPTFVEAVLKAASREPGTVGMITTLVTYFNEEDSTTRGVWAPIGFERDLLCITNCASTCTALMDREVVNRLGGYDTAMRSYEDWDLFCRMAMNGVRATVVPESLIRYRLRGESMMRTIGMPQRDRFVSMILARYPALPANPGRAMRVLASQRLGDTGESRAMSIINENIRYRIADKVNVALKRSGMQRAIKGLASRVLGSRTKPGA